MVLKENITRRLTVLLKGYEGGKVRPRGGTTVFSFALPDGGVRWILWFIQSYVFLFRFAYHFLHFPYHFLLFLLSDMSLLSGGAVRRGSPYSGLLVAGGLAPSLKMRVEVGVFCWYFFALGREGGGRERGECSARFLLLLFL